MFGLKDTHLELLRTCFAKYPGIQQVIIYGSRAKGNYKPGSDIDLTICGNDINGSMLLKLENEIDDLLLPYKIDLSLKQHIDSPELKRHIEKVGQIFYERKDRITDTLV